jgi:hypothetical protein
MADAAYYREEAERCRKLAASPNSIIASRWCQLADEYDQLTDALTASEPEADYANSGCNRCRPNSKKCSNSRPRPSLRTTVPNPEAARQERTVDGRA